VPPSSIADATTFEAVKSNAYSILASLGPHMEAEQLAQLFSRLQVSGCRQWHQRVYEVKQLLLAAEELRLTQHLLFFV
jgi:hypothetical protein